MDQLLKSITPDAPDALGRCATPGSKPHRLLATLLLVGLASEIFYLITVWLSQSFVYGEGFEQRPLIQVLVLTASLFVLYLVAISIAIRVPRGRGLTATILALALLFRVTMLFSQPIQEIDIYRYLWDGATTAQGVSPYRYSPQQVLAADATSSLPDDLARLVTMRDRSPSIQTILGRVHYGELPTIYPPVSQAMFALTDWMTPMRASVGQRVFLMRVTIAAFDFATVLLILRLLKTTARHPGWVVAYAWCPLVIKEFANSGHSDSIAVFFTTASICCVVEGISQLNGRVWSRKVWLAPLLLALAVGVKLYPLVLAPWLLASCAAAFGWRKGLAIVALFLAISGVVLCPMLVVTSPHQKAAFAEDASAISSSDQATVSHTHESLTDLKAFLSQWEMNDFLYLIVIENLRPVSAAGGQPSAWFTVVPNAWRQTMVTPIERQFQVDSLRASFLLARTITTTVFLLLVGWLAYRAMRRPSADMLLETAFLTLAWFWLLSPTQNPWYWTWAMPLLPFARGRAWFAVSGLVFLYYLRFWLTYHWPQHGVLGTDYNGTQFFDFVVTWFEFGPWFLWLASDMLCRRYFRCQSRFVIASS